MWFPRRRADKDSYKSAPPSAKLGPYQDQKGTSMIYITRSVKKIVNVTGVSADIDKEATRMPSYPLVGSMRTGRCNTYFESHHETSCGMRQFIEWPENKNTRIGNRKESNFLLDLPRSSLTKRSRTRFPSKHYCQPFTRSCRVPANKRSCTPFSMARTFFPVHQELINRLHGNYRGAM